MERAQEQLELARERNEFARIRTDLANKRTFLAWCRTGLAVMGVGVLLEKLRLGFGAAGEAAAGLGVMGVVSLLAGPACIGFAAWRYRVLNRRVGGSEDGLFFVPEMVVLASVLAFVFLGLS